MALTLSRIMQVLQPALMQELGRPYTLGHITADPHSSSYYTSVTDLERQLTTSIAWTQRDEVNGTEAQRIDLARALLTNAVNSLAGFNAAPVNDGLDDLVDVVFD